MRFLLPLAAVTLSIPAQAQDMSQFHAGTAIPEYGKIADVASDLPLPDGAQFKVLFDAATAARPGDLNRTLEGAARFLNMHVANGIPESRIRLAVVVHGQAGFDLTSAAAYARKYEGQANPNAGLIAALVKHGVDVVICGQSAAGLGITKADLLPGVKMALSAMTADALYQQQGYTLNPF